MKKLLLFFVSLLGLPVIAAPDTLSVPLKSHVDECFELTSIVFRLAGAPEYSQCRVPGYARDIDSTFAPYKAHQLIEYAKELRKKYGISYNAVASAAASLEIKKGKVVLRPGFTLSNVKKDIDPRWTPETFQTFLKYLNDFYRQTKFRNFYSSQSGLYRLAEVRLDSLVGKIDMEWIESVFGEKLENPILIPAIANGPNNYGAGDKTTRPIVAIGVNVDKTGQPDFGEQSMRTVVHEILHRYSNPLIDERWPQIDSAAQRIYPHVRETMYKNAYSGAKTTMIEWFNNLMVILYFKEHPTPSASLEYLKRYYQNSGFIWMERSVAFMDYFLTDRQKYPTVSDFMPQVVNFVNYTAGHFDQVLDEFDHCSPYVSDAFPLPGTTISSDIDTIMIRFSQPMLVGPFGFKQADEKIALSPPIAEMPKWKDDRTFIIVLKKNGLQKGKAYRFILNKEFFQSDKTYAMKEDFEFTFKTAE